MPGEMSDPPLHGAISSAKEKTTTVFNQYHMQESKEKKKVGGIYHRSVWWVKEHSVSQLSFVLQKLNAGRIIGGRRIAGWCIKARNAFNSPHLCEACLKLRSVVRDLAPSFRVLHSTVVFCLRPLPEIRPLGRILLKKKWFAFTPNQKELHLNSTGVCE